MPKRKIFICPVCNKTEVEESEPLKSKKGRVIHEKLKCVSCGYTDNVKHFTGFLSANLDRAPDLEI